MKDDKKTVKLRVILGEEMDITNEVVKICRRIDEIEYILACKDQSERITIDLSEELEILNAKLKAYSMILNHVN